MKHIRSIRNLAPLSVYYETLPEGAQNINSTAGGRPIGDGGP